MMNDNAGWVKAVKIGGMLILVVGILMVGRWFIFSSPAESYAVTGSEAGAASVAVVKGDIQEVTIDLQSSSYTPIVVQKGIPVRFNIQAAAEDINSCNGTVVIPDYNLQLALKPGDNIFEFTPDKTGTIPYSCWMGMINSGIQVVDDLSTVDPAAVAVPVGGSGLKMPCCQ